MSKDTGAPSEPKPFLRWAGSKRAIVNRLSTFYNPTHTRYLEAFAGSACLFFHLNPKKALINDLNLHLMQTYRSVASKPISVYNRLKKMPRTSSFYYRLRPRAFDSSDEIELAANFIYLNLNCFNGLYRTNLKGQFNVPFSNNRTSNLPTLDEFKTISDTLKKATFHSSDFESFVTRNVRKGDFVYLDPPFFVSQRRVFREYGKRTFCADDLERLRLMLELIDQRGGKYLLSYADCADIKSLLKGHPYKRILVNRNIAGFSSQRKRAAELIYSN